MAKQTYAKKAKSILNKYKTRLGDDFTKDDSLAKAGLDLGMEKLAEQQEEDRQSMELDTIEPQYKYGGSVSKKSSKSYKRSSSKLPKKQTGSFVDDPPQFVRPGLFSYPPLNTPQYMPYQGDGVLLFDSQDDLKLKSNNSKSGPSSSKSGTRTSRTRVPRTSTRGDGRMPKLTPYPTDYLISEQAKDDRDLAWATQYANTENPSELQLAPVTQITPEKQEQLLQAAQNTRAENQYYNPTVSPIPLVASVAGNLLMRANNKPTEVSYDRVTPQEINLGEQREQAIRRSQGQANQIARNVRGLGMTPGATANIMVGSQADLDANLGREVGESYLQEELANARFADSAERINANIAMREAEANARERNVAKSVDQQALQNIISDIGSYFGDVQKAERYNNLYQQMPGTAKLYQDPNQSAFNRIVLGSRPIVRHDPNLTKMYR